MEQPKKCIKCGQNVGEDPLFCQCCGAIQSEKIDAVKRYIVVQKWSIVILLLMYGFLLMMLGGVISKYEDTSVLDGMSLAYIIFAFTMFFIALLFNFMSNGYINLIFRKTFSKPKKDKKD